MEKILALKRARKAAIGAVVGALVVSGLVSIGGGAAVAAAAAEVSSPPPLLQRDDNVVTSDPIPTVQIDNGYVWAQTTIGSTVYAVGKFDNAREPKAAPGTALTARSNVLAYDIQTGALLPFAPKVNGVIKAVAASPDGTRIYIGGSFNSVNGKDRWNIAALDAKTGELAPGFIPSIGGSGVYSLATAGSSVYAGGLFTQGNGTARKNLAAFNAPDGKLLPWAPTTDAQVDAMVMDPAGNNTIIGGRFAQVSGNTGLRGIGAVDKTTGVVDTAWEVPYTIKNGATTGAAAGQSGIFGLTADANGVYGTGWAYAGVETANLEGTFAAEAGTGKIRWIADCIGDHYGVYSTGKVVYTTSHTHACETNGLHPEQTPRTHRYSEAFTADARGTLGHQPNTNYKDWAGTPAPSAYDWTPDWAVGVTTGMGQAGLSITGAGNMISIGGEFRSVNNGQFEGLVRFSTAPPGGAKDKPRLSGDSWVGTASKSADSSDKVTVSIPANWDRDDLTLSYELYRSGTATPVATTTADSTWWSRPDLSLVDTTAPAGQPLQYTVVVKDSNGNTATSGATMTPPPSGPVALLSRTSGKAVGVSGTAQPAVQQTTTGAPSQQWTLIPKPNGKYQVKNVATGACLSVSGAELTDGASVIQYSCADQPHFLWSLKDAGDGYRRLAASHSGKCLTLRDGNTADGASYTQWDCGVTGGADYLKFELRPAGTVAIVAHDSGKAVGVSGTASTAVQQTITGAAPQQCTIVPKANGKFQLKNVASGACLAVSGSDQANAAPVLQWTCADSANFFWSRSDLGDGYSQLAASHSGKCLTLRDGKTADGTGYSQWDCGVTNGADYLKFELRPAGTVAIVAHDSGKAVGVSGTASPALQQTITGAAAQQWTIVPKANGKFQLKNVASGACLAVSGSDQANGAAVVQWTCADSANFLWSRADLGDGYSHLAASHSGKCLTLRDGKTNDGTSYTQWDCGVTGGADYLKFELRPVA